MHVLRMYYASLTRVLLSFFLHSEDCPGALEDEDAYAVPKALGVFKLIESPNDMTTTQIIQRIMANRAAYEARNAKKQKSEQNYYENQKAVMAEL
eukprot:5937871-Pyramimonas_sp.AAC.1